MMYADGARERRSLSYIRLAAHLARQPDAVEQIVLSIDDVAAIIGKPLPSNAEFPSWWRNDDRRMHSRAWLTAGWEVVEMRGARREIVFRRRGAKASSGE